MTSPFSLAVATPTRSGSFCMDYVGSMLELQHQYLARGIDFRFLPLANVTLIDLVRNTLANRFLWETSCTHLLFVDDEAFTPASSRACSITAIAMSSARCIRGARTTGRASSRRC
ncbi:MAG: hypothetical protein CBHOC_2229 [uncultured Caballeronia sp.]|nr:MAG: hypothetical protein CBHOC_2229 [uncultured Caballeronia sp.]